MVEHFIRFKERDLKRYMAQNLKFYHCECQEGREKSQGRRSGLRCDLFYWLVLALLV